MTHLSDYLLAPGRREGVVRDACELIDAEVSRGSGLSGLAVKSAYRLVRSIRPGMIAAAVDGLLQPFADQLDPFFQEHRTTGKPLDQVLVAERTSMADALLSITDDRVERSSHAAARRAYQQLRSTARLHVEAAAPGIAELITSHTTPA
ncbi:MAG: hypothetical protein WCF04_12265 [Candidatus Nanopelagicales bacterium]